MMLTMESSVAGKDILGCIYMILILDFNLSYR